MNWQGYWIVAVIGTASLAIAIVVLILTGQWLGTAVSVGFLPLFVLVVATFGLSVGALWEIGEWIFIVALPNPSVDLITGAIGAVAAGLLSARIFERPTYPETRG